MTDDRTWQAPDSPSAPVPPVVPAPPSGTLPPPVYGPPGGAALPAPDAAAGWAPPPKPGLIPLRPLDLGTLLGAAFRVLRRNPRPTFGVSLLVQGVVTIVTLLLVGSVTIGSILRVQGAAPQDQSAIAAGTAAFAILSALLSLFLSLVAGAWLQGILVIEVARATLGEKLTLRGLWRYAKGRIWALVGWSGIIAAAMVVAFGIVVGIIVALVATLGSVGVLLGVLVGVLGGLGLVVLGVWLGTKVALVPSAIVIERLPVRGAIARSWSLTAGYFWKVFGIQLLVWLILSVASNIAVTPFSLLGGILLAFIDPNGTNSGFFVAASIGIYVFQLLVTLVVSAIVAVISTATTALIYLDLRMRKEGLELELVRFVEARQAGATGLADPYLRPGAPAGRPSA
jgi:hypothetical protein